MSDYHLGPIVICNVCFNVIHSKIYYWINEYLGEIIEEHLITKDLDGFAIWEGWNDDWDNIKKWHGVIE